MLLSKADLPGCENASALESALGLSNLQRTGPLNVACTSAVDGRGLDSAFRWLSDRILGREADAERT